MKGSTRATRAALMVAVSVIALHPAQALAQDAAAENQDTAPPGDQPAEEDIVVTGIRASQARAIEVKREADSVVEAISAEDIGKLPDVTISDSLQRIPGVQIRREAGEGGAVNIRGLPQVTTLLNGEQFLGANSITTVQPNFTDIPSQLFAGATVFKSPTASLQQAGLSGTVDLLTRRPFDLKRGVTMSAAAEAQYGDRTEKWNPSINGLLSYNSGRFGLLVSAAYSDLDLANSYRGIQDYGVSLRNEGGSATNPGDFAVGNYQRDGLGNILYNTGPNTDNDPNTSCFVPTPASGIPPATGGTRCSPLTFSRGTAVRNGAGAIVGYDVNGDGDANDTFITPQSHTAWNRITSRERFGANASLQFQVNDELTLTADAFYTKQTQYDRTAGFQFQMVDWQSAPYLPTASRDTGAMVNGFNLNTVQTYDYDMANFDSYAETFRIRSESQNYNVQLDWDNGGTLKATVRGIYGKASRKSDQSYAQFSLTDGYQWAYEGVGNYPASLGGDVRFNPGGYRVYSQPTTVDYSSGTVNFTFPQAFIDQTGDLGRYGLKTISSENNIYQEGDMWAFRGDAEWTPSEAVSIKFGGRYGERSVDQFTFERVSPFYAGNTDNAVNPVGGCLVKWKAFDVNLNDPKCQVLDAQGNAYTAGYTRLATDPAFADIIKQYQLPANGTPPLYVLDPKAMDDSESFQNSFYPGSRNNVNPANSYDMSLKQISGYLQIDGEGELFGMPVRANGGVRIVNTKFTVRQNITGVPQPYGVSGVDAGDFFTDRDFTDVLPAFNVAVDVTDKLRFRAAYSKTMTLLDFLQWGGGLNVNYAINTVPEPDRFEATGASQGGNPALDPWRADNLEASLEYYTGRSSLIAAGVFYINVESFIENETVFRDDIPDNDGVIRNPAVPVNTITQGSGGTLKGVELSARQSLQDYGVDGFLAGFGVDANYTLSLGDTGRVDLAGNDQPFQDNSKHQANVALWYEQYGFQTRVAYNYRSKRLVASDYAGITGLAQYQRPTNYLDASISYDLTDNFTLYGQASNLTGEYERYYLTFEDQALWDNIYERRFVAGVRAKF